jgi:hypothetical protein
MPSYGTPRRFVNRAECQNTDSSHVKSDQILSVQSFTAGAELFHADGQTARINLITALLQPCYCA